MKFQNKNITIMIKKISVIKHCKYLNSNATLVKRLKYFKLKDNNIKCVFLLLIIRFKGFSLGYMQQTNWHKM